MFNVLLGSHIQQKRFYQHIMNIIGSIVTYSNTSKTIYKLLPLIVRKLSMNP